MIDHFIRLPEVMKRSGLARSTVLLWVKQKKFPQPIKLSPRVTVWKQSDIQVWIDKQQKDIK